MNDDQKTLGNQSLDGNKFRAGKTPTEQWIEEQNKQPQDVSQASDSVELEKLELLKSSFSSVRHTPKGFLREYALVQAAERLEIPLDEYRRLYELSLRKPTLLSRIWRWTGFSEKRLWDYLQLLIVPVLLGAGGFYLNNQAAERARQSDNVRHEQEQKIANDRYQKEMLSSYINDMSQLLLDNHLREANKNSEAWNIARARTITVLWKLDGQRKGQLIQFLREANLISRKQGTVISLRHTDLKLAELDSADLRYSNLRDSDLRRIHLPHANLEYADLSNTHLEDADLNYANLRNANLENASLEKANLENADLTNAKLKGTANADLKDTIQCHTILANGTESNRNCTK